MGMCDSARTSEIEPGMRCAECDAEAHENAEGWRLYRADVPDEDEEPELAAYCPSCAQREFDEDVAG